MAQAVAANPALTPSGPAAPKGAPDGQSPTSGASAFLALLDAALAGNQSPPQPATNGVSAAPLIGGDDTKPGTGAPPGDGITPEGMDPGAKSEQPEGEADAGASAIMPSGTLAEESPADGGDGNAAAAGHDGKADQSAGPVGDPSPDTRAAQATLAMNSGEPPAAAVAAGLVAPGGQREGGEPRTRGAAHGPQAAQPVPQPGSQPAQPPSPMQGRGGEVEHANPGEKGDASGGRSEAAANQGPARKAAMDTPPPPPPVPNAPPGMSVAQDAAAPFRSSFPLAPPPLDGTGMPPNMARPDMAALGLQIAAEARNGAHRFEIQLDPPELGRIEVRLDIARDGRMTTQLLVDRPETLDALMRDARGLEKALQSSGLKLEDGSVQYQLRDQSAFAGHDRRKSDAMAQGHDRRADGADDQLSPGSAIQAYIRQAGPGGIDIRV